jgi:hypothetical protein
MATDNLTAQRLRELLHYDPDTGVFTWQIAPNKRIVVGAIAGTMTSDNYIAIRIEKVSYLAHRLAWLYAHGRWPVGFIDHINRITTDYRIKNLREVTPSENRQNSKVDARSRSGIKGVKRTKEGGWQANIQVNKRSFCLGTYKTKGDAIQAYIDRASKIHTCNPLAS